MATSKIQNSETQDSTIVQVLGDRSPQKTCSLLRIHLRVCFSKKRGKPRKRKWEPHCRGFQGSKDSGKTLVKGGCGPARRSLGQSDGVSGIVEGLRGGVGVWWDLNDLFQKGEHMPDESIQ